MITKAYFVLGYALIVFLGGLIGHLKAGSQASLITGVVFSLLLLGSGIGLYLQRAAGYTSSLLLTAILFVFFTYRFTLAFKWMPAGVMAILSLGLLLILIALPNKES